MKLVAVYQRPATGTAQAHVIVFSSPMTLGRAERFRQNGWFTLRVTYMVETSLWHWRETEDRWDLDPTTPPKYCKEYGLPITNILEQQYGNGSGFIKEAEIARLVNESQTFPVHLSLANNSDYWEAFVL